MNGFAGTGDHYRQSGADLRPRRVCFVCTGNICRSPMADVVLGRLALDAPMADGTVLADHLDISSAGTGGWHAGEPMDPRARAALERRGYADHGHQARPFETAWFASTDLIVCMDRGHQQTLLGLARARAGDDRYDDRLVMLRRFDTHAGGGIDVPDPYYGDEADFEACLSMVESGCRGLAGHLAGPGRPAG
ncbi:MAG: low molecular weight protein-tyrosine-phosphatase [Mycobacterium sp.]